MDDRRDKPGSKDEEPSGRGGGGESGGGAYPNRIGARKNPATPEAG